MFKELNILKPFLEEPNREFNVREIARILKIAPATASKELKKFQKEGILKGRKERMLNLYKTDIENDSYKDLKVYCNIRKIKGSGLIESLNSFYLKPAIILFGSAASGLDTETSDIDLAVISEKTKEFPERKHFEKKLKRNLQLFITKDIKHLNNPHLINNILNGIVIQGSIKWT